MSDYLYTHPELKAEQTLELEMSAASQKIELSTLQGEAEANKKLYAESEERLAELRRVRHPSSSSIMHDAFAKHRN